MKATSHRLVHDAEGLNTGVWPVPPGHFITPADLFFERNHGPIPQVDKVSWRLEVDGLVSRPRTFSFDELIQGFPRQQVAATLVCAGLRRAEYLALGPLPGELPWGSEPASTGEWTGIALRDVLQTVGVTERARYVEFTGLDAVERDGNRFGFGGSIDLDKALCPEVLLASELNGEPLTMMHGFPIRAVVPGWIGARSVKWLGRITLREDPSPNYFQSKAYRAQREINPRDPRDVSAGVALCGVPLNAVVLEPGDGQVVPAGRVRVRGWAMGSEGRPVTAVELSLDNGRRWFPAEFSVPGRPWTWTLWESVIDLKPGSHTLIARATDAAGTTQPETPGATWNVKGYNNNAWYRIEIRAE